MIFSLSNMDTTLAGVIPETQVPETVTNTEQIPKSKLQKLKHWYNHLTTFKKIIFIFLIFLIIVLLISAVIYGYIIYKGYQNNNMKSNGGVSINQTPTMTPTPVTKIDPLTGVSYSGSNIDNLLRPPLAVMIENSIPARPQTGLNEADVVYETLAEGGITRFMAVFLGNTPKTVGPIRSARTYFLPWAMEYNAIYTHWGENSDVAPSLPADNIRNLDALYQGGTDQSCTTSSEMFCRDETRAAPHNGYGFPSKIWNYASSQGWTGPSNFATWTFKKDADTKSRGIDGSYVNIDFMPSDPDYSVKWVYSQANNLYTRFDNGTAQMDRNDNSPISAKNLVVMYVNGQYYTSTGGKEVWSYDETGSGKASVFVDGKEIDGTWKKDTLTSRTLFYDSANLPISFDEGRTWVTVLVNNTGSFTSTN